MLVFFVQRRFSRPAQITSDAFVYIERVKIMDISVTDAARSSLISTYLSLAIEKHLRSSRRVLVVIGSMLRAVLLLLRGRKLSVNENVSLSIALC